MSHVSIRFSVTSVCRCRGFASIELLCRVEQLKLVRLKTADASLKSLTFLVAVTALTFVLHLA